MRCDENSDPSVSHTIPILFYKMSGKLFCEDVVHCTL